ncbi:MAG: AAA family ATPase, partial [Candidatus Bathyarchaeota archaeon]
MVRNFKSFSGKLKLNFQPGFNVITGPNGSGKSNIIDAVQFVFGELGSKRMRVPELSGVIFDGASEQGSKPKYAQVTIYFNNSDRALAVDRNTVSVGRRIDTQGKSKYYLNGRRTSRRALLEILEMAGITPGGYNIVLQGTATRLSDLTPSERMTALEDLVGITEYDEKKAEAKVRLNEAERKIEVASAKGDEVRRRVVMLEKERNDALRQRLLEREERNLEAYRLSDQLERLEDAIQETKKKIEENDKEIKEIEEDREKLLVEREKARENLDEFTNEASEKGNTRLPMLRSEVAEKETLKRGLEIRLRELDSRNIGIQGNIEAKLAEIERAESEKEGKQNRLRELVENESNVSALIAGKETDLGDIAQEITAQKELAEQNLKTLEQLTENLVPMQESLSGLEIEINRHLVSSNSIQGKLEDLERKRKETLDSIGTLEGKIVEYEALKEEEAENLEKMLDNIEGQVERQKGIRDTI